MKKYEMPDLDFQNYQNYLAWSADHWQDYISFTEGYHGLRVRISANLQGELRLTHGDREVIRTQDWLELCVAYQNLMDEL